ncbi:hypothetical protein NC99_28440 [Sunxiuqinia dokdonensis]|uniref:Uncharacterized protein n=1 Tax=Sunxiuqinia dokdonensis TaxID=1409788 RepID=A0A0L8V865_9BACT|nr:hypothetical protein NC99_28440 [Sunxiuqinia dokdonensis]
MAEIRELANQKISQMAPLKISDERPVAKNSTLHNVELRTR